jgi:hypothetical protein
MDFQAMDGLLWLGKLGEFQILSLNLCKLLVMMMIYRFKFDHGHCKISL